MVNTVTDETRLGYVSLRHHSEHRAGHPRTDAVRTTLPPLYSENTTLSSTGIWQSKTCDFHCESNAFFHHAVAIGIGLQISYAKPFDTTRRTVELFGYTCLKALAEFMLLVEFLDLLFSKAFCIWLSKVRSKITITLGNVSHIILLSE